MAKQCTEDHCDKVDHLPPLDSKLTVPCSIQNCRWVGDISLLEDHHQEKHQGYIFQPSERASSTHSIISKTYIDTEESLEDKIQEIQGVVLVLRKKLTQLKKELSFCESEYKTSRDKLKEVKEEKENDCSNEPHATQLNRYKQLESNSYQKVIAKRKEKEVMEEQIKWVERDKHEHKERLLTWRSYRSKFEEPVRLIERTPIPSNRQSAASSVASMGLANSQHSLNQERSTDSLTVQARSEQVQDSTSHTAVSDALQSLSIDPSSQPRTSTNISPSYRRSITLPSIQTATRPLLSVGSTSTAIQPRCPRTARPFTRQARSAALRPSLSEGSTITAVQPRPPRSARPSIRQARSAALRCHRRRSSLESNLK